MGNICETSVEVVSKELFSLFKKLAGQHVHFVEPGGNFGDHIIYKGAYKLARLANLKCHILSFAEFQKKDFSERDIIYIHGGGGFVPWWSGTPMKMLQKLSIEFRGKLILGPTTFSDDEQYIRTIFNDCIGKHSFKEFFIFTREKLSFEILKKHLPCRAEIFLDHDTALNLVESDLVEGKRPKATHEVYALRRDKELVETQAYNYFLWLDPIDVSYTFDEWLRFHLQAKRLITNRTHSTILGAILGIPTIMLPNSYHKNRSIWEHSLRAKNIQWMDTYPCPDFFKVFPHNRFLNGVFNSHKYKRWLRRLVYQ